jgi:hypothetical protein
MKMDVVKKEREKIMTILDINSLIRIKSPEL